MQSTYKSQQLAELIEAGGIETFTLPFSFTKI